MADNRPRALRAENITAPADPEARTNVLSAASYFGLGWSGEIVVSGEAGKVESGAGFIECSFACFQFPTKNLQVWLAILSKSLRCHISQPSETWISGLSLLIDSHILISEHYATSIFADGS